MLRQRVDDLLGPARRILLAGAGGGYDVLGAVPLLVELEAAGKEVHLGSLTFSAVGARGERSVAPFLYEVTGSTASETTYTPEAWLSAWLSRRSGRIRPVWCFEKTGAKPLREAYAHLVAALQLDAAILVDGGIDALLRGDESSIGTPEEDLASLAAVHALEIPTKILSCVGLGAEWRDGICHEQAFERIAELGRLGAQLGVEAVLRDSAAGRAYLDALDFVTSHQAGVRKSHVHKMIRWSMNGEYGASSEHVWISPLLSLYWHFALEPVASTNLHVPYLAETTTIWEVTRIIEGRRMSIPIKDRTSIPI